MPIPLPGLTANFIKARSGLVVPADYRPVLGEVVMPVIVLADPSSPSLAVAGGAFQKTGQGTVVVAGTPQEGSGAFPVMAQTTYLPANADNPEIWTIGPAPGYRWEVPFIYVQTLNNDLLARSNTHNVDVNPYSLLAPDGTFNGQRIRLLNHVLTVQPGQLQVSFLVSGEMGYGAVEDFTGWPSATVGSLFNDTTAVTGRIVRPMPLMMFTYPGQIFIRSTGSAGINQTLKALIIYRVTRA